MAKYKGRTFTASCSECGAVKTATHQHKADAQAESCYQSHFADKTRDTKEIMDEIKREIPDWDGG